ncbi:MAG: hypothetical protein HY689_16085 [Chloroflexi bacterium]|nr:hypothetical protein [Chloroflexota bacterium]
MPTPNTLLYKGSVSWANADPAGTAKTVDLTLPAGAHQPQGLYVVMVTNPSTESDVTVVVRNQFTDPSSTVRRPELTRFGVAKNQSDGRAFVVQGWFAGDPGGAAGPLQRYRPGRCGGLYRPP